MSVKFSRVVILFCFTIVLNGCGKSSREKEINRVMDRREEAFNEKILQEYLKVFSKKYTDKKGDISSLEKRMKKNFEAFETIKFKHDNRDIFIKGNTARVVQDFTLDFSIRIGSETKVNSIKGKEMFKLEKAGSDWLILEGE